ncbi:hypothetical protein H0W91_03565 [Patescibacteria group bacterium]|nr:hypothetical protein [Patescibacteria group bacterium]
MTQKTLNIILMIVILFVVGIVGYYGVFKRAEPVAVTPTENKPTTNNNVTPITKVSYRNTDYGFSFNLPDSWKNYTIITDKWEGNSLTPNGQSQVKTQEGPLISIRHPDWDYKSPRQDIPVMVFTIDQWNRMLKDEFHIGAAPINPSELGRNSKYVFALPARYNFAYATGYEEVQKIIKDNTPLKTF